MRIILNDCPDPRRALDLILGMGVDIYKNRSCGWIGADGVQTDYRITKNDTVSVRQYGPETSDEDGECQHCDEDGQIVDGGYMTCPVCNGTKKTSVSEAPDCKRCNDEKVVHDPPTAPDDGTYDCPDCSPPKSNKPLTEVVAELRQITAKHKSPDHDADKKSTGKICPTCGKPPTVEEMYESIKGVDFGAEEQSSVYAPDQERDEAIERMERGDYDVVPDTSAEEAIEVAPELAKTLRSLAERQPPTKGDSK